MKNNLYAKRPEKPQFSKNMNIFPGNLIKSALKSQDIHKSKREVFSETPFNIRVSCNPLCCPCVHKWHYMQIMIGCQGNLLDIVNHKWMPFDNIFIMSMNIHQWLAETGNLQPTICQEICIVPSKLPRVLLFKYAALMWYVWSISTDANCATSLQITFLPSTFNVTSKAQGT